MSEQKYNYVPNDTKKSCCYLSGVYLTLQSDSSEWKQKYILELAKQ